MIKIVMSLLTVGLLAGCATSADIRNAPVSAGISRDFQITFEKTQRYALESLKDLGLTVESAETASDVFTIQFSQAAGLFSWGEIGRVNVLDLPPDASRVAVYSLKRNRMQVTGTSNADFAEKIFESIDEKAAID